MPLSDIEVRVLGALVEKERTTPDAYPLSSQALLSACNQRTSRQPVTDYHLQEVQEAAFQLRERGFLRTVQELSDRVPKHRHDLQRVWDVNDLELALMAVLMLRGTQTPGELRSRIERYGVPNDMGGVEAALEGLGRRSSPLVEKLARAPGQSQDRWRHALGNDEARLRPRVRAAEGAQDNARAPTSHAGAAQGNAGAAPGHAGDAQAGTGHAGGAVSPTGVAGLEARVEELERRVETLERILERLEQA